MLVHLFVCVTLLLVLNLYALHVHLVRPTVLMASAVIRVPPTWNLHVLALVLLRLLFPSMLVKKFVPISPTLLLLTRQLKVLKLVLWRWVYHLRSLLGMVPTHRIWCGVNALHLTMANWTFMNPLSLPYTSFMALVLLCLSSGPCTNACVKRLVHHTLFFLLCVTWANVSFFLFWRPDQHGRPFKESQGQRRIEREETGFQWRQELLSYFGWKESTWQFGEYTHAPKDRKKIFFMANNHITLIG